MNRPRSRTRARVNGMMLHKVTGWSARRLGWYKSHPYFSAILILMVVLIVLGNTVAYAAGPFDPIGFGDLFVQPNLAGGYSKTLYEEIPISAYSFDTDLGLTEVPEKVIGLIANFLMFLLYSIIRGAIVIVWVLTSFAGWTGITEVITPAIAALSTEFASWLLPSALAIGGLVAFWQRRNSGDAFGQIVWVAVSAAIALTMTYSAATWVGAVNGMREIGTSAVASASAKAITETETPFTGPAASYGGPIQDTNLRKIGDSIWRAYVVTPWCVAEFGSLAACNEWGYELVQAGDAESRKEFLQSKYGEMGKGAEDWVKGKAPADRLGITAIALLIGISFAVLIVGLSVAAGFALASAMLLLFVGSIFVMMWCIPGTPRRWGLAWLQTLIGFVLQSVLATLILTAVLSLTAAAFGLIDSYGWGIAATVALTLGFAAFGLRRTLNQILGFGTSTGGGGAGLLGYMALRGSMKAVRGIGRGARRAVGGGAKSGAGDTSAGGGANGPGDGARSGPNQGGGGSRGTSRRFNQNKGRIWAQTANQTTAGKNRSSDGPGPASNRTRGNDQPNTHSEGPQATPRREPEGQGAPSAPGRTPSSTAPVAVNKATRKRNAAAQRHTPPIRV